MTCRGSAATAVSKSTRISRYFADFRGNGGSLALRAASKSSFTVYTREVVFCRKNYIQQAFKENVSAIGVKWAHREN